VPNKPFALSVKAVVIDERRRCLLLRRSKNNGSFVGCWEWPGGKVDPGEDFAVAVVRETKEETGLDVEITGVAGATQFETVPVNVVLLCMAARVTGGELRLSKEHDDVAWVDTDEMARRQLPPPIREFMLSFAERELRLT
jgi:mutator protein MutT